MVNLLCRNSRGCGHKLLGLCEKHWGIEQIIGYLVPELLMNDINALNFGIGKFELCDVEVI